MPVDLAVITPEAPASAVALQARQRRDGSHRYDRVKTSEAATSAIPSPSEPPTSPAPPRAALHANPPASLEVPPPSTEMVVPEPGPAPQAAAMPTTPTGTPENPAITSSRAAVEREAAQLSASVSHVSPGGSKTPTDQDGRSGQSETAPGSGEKHASVPTTPTEQAGFSAPRLRREGKLRYPERARATGVEGTVIVKVHVLATGKVAAAEIVRSAGNPLLDRAAIDSILTAQFTPARRGDVPVPVWVEVPVEFKLER